MMRPLQAVLGPALAAAASVTSMGALATAPGDASAAWNNQGTNAGDS